MLLESIRRDTEENSFAVHNYLFWKIGEERVRYNGAVSREHNLKVSENVTMRHVRAHVKTG